MEINNRYWIVGFHFKEYQQKNLKVHIDMDELNSAKGIQRMTFCRWVSGMSG